MKDLSTIENYSLEELVNHIIEKLHEPIREKLEKIQVLLKKFWEKIEHKEKLSLPKEVFKQLIDELVNHLNREKNEFYPEVINLENNNSKDFLKIKNFLRLQKSEHEDLANYLNWWKSIIDQLDIEWDEDFSLFKKMAEELYKSILDTVYIEDNHLNTKIEKYCEGINCKGGK